MTLAPIQRGKICEALLEFRKNYEGSQTDFCKTMGINPAAYSQLKAAIRDGKPLDRIIADDKLVVLGRRLNVNFSSAAPWKVVSTETYEYITTQLAHCKANSIGRILCEIADIGKTTAAKQYMLTQQNVFYVDCSQCKSRTEFIRAIAKVVGVNSLGSLKDVYKDTIYMLHAMELPLMILDEAGDLNYPAFLEIKSYWNALEGACGWYMMGADGLSAKIDANIRGKRVGYAEIFRRFGSEYMSLTGKKDKVEVVQFKQKQVYDVAYHNVPEGVDAKEVARNVLSLTKVKENIRKAAKGDRK